MRGAALPAALLFAALALQSGFLPRKLCAAAVAIAVFAALLTANLAQIPSGWNEAVFIGCWASAIGIAALVYLPRPPATAVAVALAIVAGIFAGLVTAAEGRPFDLVRALPALLLVLPVSFAVARGAPVVPRVAASWLIAICLLAAILPYAVTHPGYIKDHQG